MSSSMSGEWLSLEMDQQKWRHSKCILNMMLYLGGHNVEDMR